MEAPITKISVVNEVLGRFNETTIANLDDANNKDAVDYKAAIIGLTNQYLSMNNWNFARAEVELNATEESPRENYKWEFAMPEDRFGEVRFKRNKNSVKSYNSGFRGGYGGYGEGNRDNANSIIEANKIYANTNPISIIYVRQLEFEQCPGYFQQLVKVAFANYVRDRNFGGVPPEKIKELDDMYEAALDQNRMTDSGYDLDSYELLARYVGGGGYYGSGGYGGGY